MRNKANAVKPENRRYEFTDFQNRTHLMGRIWSAAAILLLCAVPVLMMLYFHESADSRGLVQGALSICLIFLPSSVVEVFTYAPMMGSGATYLAFLTGNLVNLKVPCAANARDIAGTQHGTEENEVVSTISVAVSTLVTTLVIALGVLLIVPLTPVITSPRLAPAFASVVPALFGALAYKHFSKHLKLTVVPLLVMLTLCLLVPSLANQVAFLVPIAAVLSIAAAYVMYRKGMV